MAVTEQHPPKTITCLHKYFNPMCCHLMSIVAIFLGENKDFSTVEWNIAKVVIGFQAKQKYCSKAINHYPYLLP